MTQTSIVVSAVSLELFSTTTVNNDSGTTIDAPFLHVTDIPVTFTISGESGIGAGVITVGTKYALLELPPEMIGNVETGDMATVSTIVSVPLANSPINGILSTLNNVVTTVVNAVSSELGHTVNEAFNLLKSEDFGAHVLSLPIEELAPNRFGVDISHGLLPILTSTLSSRLQNLRNVITSIPLIGIILGILLSPFTTAINNLLTELSNPNSATSINLVSASLLGKTDVEIPTLVSSPELATDFLAEFKAGFIQTNELVIQLGGQSGDTTTLYFSAGKLSWIAELLPEQLNFGNHPIQTVEAELWTAYEGGNAVNPITTGILSVEDTRSGEKNWQVKVEQLSEWTQPTPLLGAQLRIHGGALNTSFPVEKITSIANQTINLQVNTQQTLLALNQVSETGIIELNILEFQLYVPANTPKIAGKYTTTLRWTVSDAP